MFDITGILILIVVIVAFGFLTTRAWKLKNAFLKWPGVFIAGLLTLIPAALLVLALIGFSKLNERYDNPAAVIQITGTPAQIARGEKLDHICSSCHSPGDELPLSGTNFAAKFDFPPLGTLYAPNLTPSGNIQDWTDGEVIRAIREGVHKSGRALLIMPAGSYRNMSDDDVYALVAYLRSQPATGAPTPNNQFMTFFNTGTLPGGTQVPMLTLASGFSEPRMPWPMVRAVTTDDELKDMYGYLHSLSAVASPVR